MFLRNERNCPLSLVVHTVKATSPGDDRTVGLCPFSTTYGGMIAKAPSIWIGSVAVIICWYAAIMSGDVGEGGGVTGSVW